jgi:D-3-phosphoglycerate dehydrogenase
MEIKILCNGMPDFATEAKAVLESIGTVDYADWDYQEILANIEKYRIFLPNLSVNIDKNILKKAKNLKLIATPTTGTDHIDLKTAEANGIAVLSIKNDIDFLKNIPSTAELALGLLSVVRRIPFAFDAVKEGRWSREDYRGNTLFGKTLGIIGYGRLGEIMARYGNALGMKVLAVDPYKQIDVRYAEPVSLDELLKRSDVISVHVHLNEETKGMIGRDEINRMKDGVIIINTARGAVIDEDAFVEGLICGKIGGAGIDVIADETLRNIKDTPLVEYARRHQNLVITPHIGGATIEAQKLTYLKIAEKVKTWISGRKSL